MLVLFFSPIGLGRQSVEVTEQGIHTRSGGKRSFVRWEKARLFARYNAWGAQKSGSSLSYELSSATDIARWVWVLRPKSFRMQIIPTVPFEEYTRQMQALDALIVARTGLPLYDLNKEPTIEMQQNFI